MGEERTAGQVGGLESSRGVRERLAGESRRWRCGGCGGEEEGGDRKGWTNEERMKWWWDVCREKGVNVEAEVEGLEDLPEGMQVEARVKVDKGKQKEEDPQDADAEQTETTVKDQGLSRDAPEIPVTAQRDEDTVQQTATQPFNAAEPQYSQQVPLQPTPTTQAPPLLATNNIPTISYRPHNRGTSTDAPTAPQQQQFQNLQQMQQRQADSHITIDRAIAGVFLALLIMILKKVFYPSTAGGVFGGYDDLRMTRE